ATAGGNHECDHGLLNDGWTGELHARLQSSAVVDKCIMNAVSVKIDASATDDGVLQLPARHASSWQFGLGYRDTGDQMKVHDLDRVGKPICIPFLRSRVEALHGGCAVRLIIDDREWDLHGVLLAQVAHVDQVFTFQLPNRRSDAIAGEVDGG